jgi:hypothetical protein
MSQLFHSRVILTGVEQEQGAIDRFYTGLADTALEAGVSVSVISIIGEECQLERLGYGPSKL